MKSPYTDQELKIKAQKLRQTKLLGDGTNTPMNKQLVFYVLAGVKPLSEVVSLRLKEESNGYLESVPDNQKQVVAFLAELGLSVEATSEDQYLVALDKKHIAAYKQALRKEQPADIYRSVGTIFGYPATAVEACVADWANNSSSLLTNDEQDQLIAKAGLPIEACVFRLSRAHYKEEIAEVARWYDVLTKYGMLTVAS